jgi:hypothetical protein
MSSYKMTSPNPAPYKYNPTAKGLMMWANSELEHVGRIAAVEDPNIQYAYALSTLNGMAHLKDAIYEYVSANPDANDLLIIHKQVIRVMKHLIRNYDLDVGTIEAFNTQGTLSTLNYLKETQSGGKRSPKTRKNRKSRKSRK